MSDVAEPVGDFVHLKNPPIIEAAIAIDVALLPVDILEQFEMLTSEMEQLGYAAPKPVTAHTFQMNFDVGDQSIRTEGSALGLRFDGNSCTTQFKRDGFLFSHLGRYDRWETFISEAEKVWKVYNRTIGPAEFKEFGVRYINKIYLPNGEPLEKYLRLYPLVPSGLPHEINESFMRLGFPIKDSEGQAGRFVHQHILTAPERENFSTLLLDNDFRFSAIGLKSSAIWDRLEKVRRIKDEYFFSIITKDLQDSFNV